MQEKLLETLPQESRLDQQIPAPQVSTRGMGNRDVQVENMMAEERTKEIVDEIENNPSVFQRMADYFMSFFEQREPKAEGGDVDDQMGVLIAIQPSEEEMNDEMLPDGEMEDDYIDYIISNSLNPEEENYLLSKLEQDDQLSMLFDKVIETASEFSGAGPVEGPGSGISDSIPARLSDGEFVFTAKATEQIGADTLQRMMEDAEAEADQRQPAYNGGEMEEQPSRVIESTVRVTKPVNRNIPALGMAQEAQLQTSEEIKKNMLNPNVNYIRS